MSDLLDITLSDYLQKTLPSGNLRFPRNTPLVSVKMYESPNQQGITRRPVSFEQIAIDFTCRKDLLLIFRKIVEYYRQLDFRVTVIPTPQDFLFLITLLHKQTKEYLILSCHAEAPNLDRLYIQIVQD